MRAYRSIIALAAVLLLALPLGSLELRFGTGKSRHISIEELRQAPQSAFSTSRQKGLEQVVDMWEGIELLSWMQQIGAKDWHSLNFISRDGYSVSLHRAELEMLPVYIALRDADAYLDEAAIRLIFPTRRDNIWVRGLDVIELQGFEPLPPPRQLFILEDYLRGTLGKKSSASGMAFRDVMVSLFRQDSGSVVFVGDAGIQVRLDYPTHLANAFLAQSDDHWALESADLPQSVCIRQIVYIQCGAQAFVAQASVSHLQDLAKALGWDYDGLMRKTWIVTPARKAFTEENAAEKLKPGSWIEMR